MHGEFISFLGKCLSVSRNNCFLWKMVMRATRRCVLACVLYATELTMHSFSSFNRDNNPVLPWWHPWLEKTIGIFTLVNWRNEAAFHWLHPSPHRRSSRSIIKDRKIASSPKKVRSHIPYSLCFASCRSLSYAWPSQWVDLFCHTSIVSIDRQAIRTVRNNIEVDTCRSFVIRPIILTHHIWPFLEDNGGASFLPSIHHEILIYHFTVSTMRLFRGTENGDFDWDEAKQAAIVAACHQLSRSRWVYCKWRLVFLYNTRWNMGSHHGMELPCQRRGWVVSYSLEETSRWVFY
jgi:hypothetical protein